MTDEHSEGVPYLFNVITYLLLAGFGFASCKTLEQESLLQGVPEQTEVERVNKPYAIDRTQLARATKIDPNNAYAMLDKFVSGEMLPGESAYRKNWNVYQNFLLGDADEPENMKCLRHRVHFYFDEVEISSTDIFGAPQTEQKKSETDIADEGSAANVDDSQEDLSEGDLISSQRRECPNAEAAEYVLSFDLHNFRQPDASRNLLALIASGFYDGKDLFLFQNSDAMPALGNASIAEDPFFFPPDPKYSERTPEINKDHFSNDVLDLTKVSIFYKEQVQAQIPSSLQSDVLMMSVENPVGVDLARRMLPFRVIFSNFVYAAQEEILGQVKLKTFPIPFGTLVTPFPGKSLSKVRQLLLPLRRNKNLKVMCVAIEPLPLKPYDAVQARCPEVLGI